MIVLAKEHSANLVKQHLQVQFVWTNEPNSDVTLTFTLDNRVTMDRSMSKSEAREFWAVMLNKRGYAKGVKCSTHPGK